MGFDRRRQPIAWAGMDPQFQIGNIVENFVGRYDFDGVTAGNQIARQYSRAPIRARNDSCQRHTRVAPAFLVSHRERAASQPRYNLRKNSGSYQGITLAMPQPASFRRPFRG